MDRSNDHRAKAAERSQSMPKEHLGVPMRYLRTSSSSPLSALRVVATSLDACWWYLDGNSLSVTKEFAARLRPLNWSDDRVLEYWMTLMTEYVVNDTLVGQIGKPGFFANLGDSADFRWTCLAAIESTQLPLASLDEVAKAGTHWINPLDGLPADVVMIARDIDSAYQEYGFRDEWMFKAVLGDLLGRGLPTREVAPWARAGTRQ